MKKKFLTFMLALIFVIPCMFAIAGCGEKPCTHANTTHGLCDCGHYTGTTLTLGESQSNLEIEKDAKLYFRYEVEAGQHYQRTGSNIPTDDIKYFAKYNSGWSEVSNYKIIDNLPKDGYIYVEITASAKTTNASFKMDVATHDVDGTIDGSEDAKTMSLGSYATRETVCAAITLTKGFVYEFETATPDDDYVCANIINVYTTEGEVVAMTANAGKLVLDLTDAEENFSGYVHIYINSQDSSNVINVTKVQE